MIVFVHNFIKTISIFFKFTLELYFYVLYPISVMVCCKKVWVHFEKSKVPAVQPTKIGAVKKIIVFVHNFMKNSLTFFKFTQELYFYMLCLIPVMVCSKKARLLLEKSKSHHHYTATISFDFLNAVKFFRDKNNLEPSLLTLAQSRRFYFRFLASKIDIGEEKRRE